MASFDSQNLHFLLVEEKRNKIERHADKTTFIYLQWHKYIKRTCLIGLQCIQMIVLPSSWVYPWVFSKHGIYNKYISNCYQFFRNEILSTKKNESNRYVRNRLLILGLSSKWHSNLELVWWPISCCQMCRIWSLYFFCQILMLLEVRDSLPSHALEL